MLKFGIFSFFLGAKKQKMGWEAMYIQILYVSLQPKMGINYAHL